jgi:hypothetical protein
LEIIQKVNEVNKENSINMIQLKHTNKLENIDEFIIIKDNATLLNARYNDDDDNNDYELSAFLSNEQNKIWIQEIIVEKYWNETNSLWNENYT